MALFAQSSTASTSPGTPVTINTLVTHTKDFLPPSPAILSICSGPSITAPSSCYNLKDTVVIRVQEGKKRKDYTLLRGLLIWHSSYFAARLDPEGGWPQVSEEPLDLECEHDTFDAFCCWLHTNRLKDPVTKTTGIEANDIYLLPPVLVNIWVFADFRGIPALGNAAIDMLHERIIARSLPNQIVKEVYEKTGSRSKLRTYLVDLYKSCARVDFIVQNPHTYTVEFLCEVLPFLARKTGDPSGKLTMTQLNRCKWHDHSGPGGKLRIEGRNKTNSSPQA